MDTCLLRLTAVNIIARSASSFTRWDFLDVYSFKNWAFSSFER